MGIELQGWTVANAFSAAACCASRDGLLQNAVWRQIMVNGIHGSSGWCAGKWLRRDAVLTASLRALQLITYCFRVFALFGSVLMGPP